MTRLPFELLLALRYLRPKRTFVSTITLISIVGVMLGVAVLIVVISVMSGFDQQLRDKLLGFNAHMRIYSDRAIYDYEQIIKTVSADPHVKGVTPYVMGQILVRTQPEAGNPRIFFPVVRGIDPELEKKAQLITPDMIVEGEFDVSGGGLLVGRDFAMQMDVHVGDRLGIYSIEVLQRMDEAFRKAREENRDITEGYLPTEFEIKGIFDAGYYEFNNMFVICSLADAQDLFGLGNQVQGLMVTLYDPDQSAKVRAELGPLLSSRFSIAIWQEETPILDALVVEKNVMFYLLFFIMIVAAFGITSALITFVVQKTREIGILKAVGASRWQIMVIFLSQSLTVGLFGVAFGLGLGIVAVHYRNEFLFAMRRFTGMELFPARVYNFSELPALIDPKDIVLICGGSLIICLLAGLFPAWNAGRLKPVEALRHE